MAILNNSNAISSGGYDINNSLRFRASASAQLTRTPAGAGNNNKITISFWAKRGELSKAFQNLFTSGASAGNGDATIFTSGDAFRFWLNGGSNSDITTTQVFRDPSAWYHIVVAIDTTQATAANRIKIYVNGNQVTAFSSATYPAQNYAIQSFNTTTQQQIGYGVTTGNGGNYFDGYMTEINFVDGQTLTPSDFGETDTTTGSWKPKAYTGTYGTNGFYLKFSDIATTSGSNAGLGKDFSGNANYWTTNNISVTAGTTYDAMIDSPTLTSATVANYAVMNPLVGSVGVTLSQANLSATFDSASGTRYGTIGTIGVSSGKWYWEYEFSAGGNSALLGITQKPFAVQMGAWPGEQTGDYGYFGSNGNKYTAGSGSAYGATFTTGDIIGVALDLDAGTLTFYKNNTSQGTAFSSISGTFFPAIGKGITATGITSFVNFGQRPFTYTPPTGFVRLNTYNLPDSTIKKGNTVMDATLYTGNGTSQTITTASSFKPDLVWIKGRSFVDGHTLFDTVRGATISLSSNTTTADVTRTTALTAFTSTGFTVGSDTLVNFNANTLVAWQWQAGQGSTSSNTNGSITSTVSVNATAGFSVVTWTGNGTIGATVGHGLGVAPSMIIVKQRSGTESWATYHISLGATKYLNLNQDIAAATSITRWNNTTPSSTVITFYNDDVTNRSGGTYVAYCWAEIAGFSKFTSYVGNGSTDGPFVFLGFRPKFVLMKNITTAGYAWQILDTSRNTYNVMNAQLFPNSSAAEDTTNVLVDYLSNGFKLRNADGAQNLSSNTYIVAAFAENPFKNSLAR